MNFDTPDGSCIRDFIHVVDLASAHVAAIGRMEAQQMAQSYEVFNIGTGKGHSVLELIGTFQTVTGTRLNYSDRAAQGWGYRKDLGRCNQGRAAAGLESRAKPGNDDGIGLGLGKLHKE